MWSIVVLFSFTVMSAGAQNTINAASGPWTASLDGMWRWHAGDNTQWASAAFDDSAWSPLPVPGPLPPARQYWIRLHVQTGETPDSGLLLGPIAFAYDVYWDGQQIGRFGDLSRSRWFAPRWHTFHIPHRAINKGNHAIALRISPVGVAFGTRGPRLGAGDNRIGDFVALREVESRICTPTFSPSCCSYSSTLD